ncbi:MAG: hypothetical protein J6Y91_03450 [Alphaproteobacteria bacterium]|nr:hypothetical protein [Alphaproteobacteria bacterium]
MFFDNKDEEKEESQEQETDKKAVKKTQKGFDDGERLTLKINVKEATRYDAIKDKKTVSKSQKNVKKPPKNIYKEDEEEEEIVDKDVIRSLQELQINQNDASNGDNSLINALLPHEKRQIEQSTNIEITRQEENAGRHDALERTDKMLRQAGMSKMTTQEFMNQMTDAIYEPSRLKREAFENNIEQKVGIEGKISKRDEDNVVKGVKKVNEVTDHHKVRKVTTQDVAKVGQQNLSNNKTAEMILEKSGQTAKLEEIKKNSVAAQNSPKDNKPKNKSYAKEMKDLLRNSLKKNDKVR